jgi:hypothetical protein
MKNFSLTYSHKKMIKSVMNQKEYLKVAYPIKGWYSKHTKSYQNSTTKNDAIKK